MQKLNYYQKFIIQVLSKNSNKDIVCIDLDFWENKKTLAYNNGFIFKGKFIGSHKSWLDLFNRVLSDKKQTDLVKFLDSLNYSFRLGKKYEFAVKQKTLF